MQYAAPLEKNKSNVGRPLSTLQFMRKTFAVAEVLCTALLLLSPRRDAEVFFEGAPILDVFRLQIDEAFADTLVCF